MKGTHFTIRLLQTKQETMTCVIWKQNSLFEAQAVSDFNANAVATLRTATLLIHKVNIALHLTDISSEANNMWNSSNNNVE